MRLGPTGLPVLDGFDVACGFPAGRGPGPVFPDVPDPDPARALRDALRPALRHGPCVVAFSGGRDSSLLLAVAADLAAREGLDAPVALTFRYPGDPAADESAWQELVLAGLRAGGRAVEWVRHDITDEQDLIGPVGGPLLRAHGGPTFPAAIANTVLLARHAAGGSLVTGNGGDEVLGGHRAAVLRAVLRRRGRGLTGADRRLVAAAATPGVVRGLRAGTAPWLRPELRRAARAEARRAEAARPLRWDRSVRAALVPRAVAIGDATRRRVAQDHRVRLVEPLADAAFVGSWAAAGDRVGGTGRAGGTRLLAAGLLPEAVVRRGDKAWFNASRFGPATRAFASAWDGGGIDRRLVDVDVLRAAWLSAEPPGGTALLLHQAWLATGQR